VSDLVRRNPGMVKEMLKEDFVVEGVAPLTRSDMVNVVNEAINAKHEQLISKLRNHGILRESDASVSAPSASETASIALTTAFGGLESYGARWHLYGGKFHYLPKGFKLFTGPAKPMWFMWHLGNKSLEVGPYSMINKHKEDLQPLIDEQGKTKDQKKQFDKIKKVMDRLFNIAKECYQAGGGQGELVISETNIESTFDQAYPVLINELYSPQTLQHMNPNVICCTTLGKIFINTMVR
jgi:hemerythrin